MATCPRCRQFLDEDHVCKGVGAMRAREVLTLAVTAVGGAVLGGVLFGMLGDAVKIAELEVVGVIAGPIAAVILVRAMRIG